MQTGLHSREGGPICVYGRIAVYLFRMAARRQAVRVRISAKKRREFLDQLERGASVKHAREFAGISADDYAALLDNGHRDLAGGNNTRAGQFAHEVVRIQSKKIGAPADPEARAATLELSRDLTTY